MNHLNHIKDASYHNLTESEEVLPNESEESFFYSMTYNEHIVCCEKHLGTRWFFNSLGVEVLLVITWFMKTDWASFLMKRGISKLLVACPLKIGLTHPHNCPLLNVWRGLKVWQYKSTLYIFPHVEWYSMG